MLFSDQALSRRLEGAEGYACRQFAVARRRLFPETGSEATRVAGTDVVFDGPTSFFTTRGAATHHEVSPFAGVATLQLLCARAYHPIKVSNVLYRPIEFPFETVPAEELTEHIQVHIVGRDWLGSFAAYLVTKRGIPTTP